MTETLLETSVPEKFKDPATGNVNLENLVKSYNELEQRFSRQPRPPRSAKEYCIDCKHGLFEVDEEMNERLHQKGFTQDQVQFVYDLAAEKMVPLIVQMASDYQADREIERLVDHFGGVEKWVEMSRQLLAFGQKHLPADVLDTLSSSYEGVLALHNMMKGEEPGVGLSEGREGPGAAELDLQSMMRDPRYWREKDPSFIAKVTEGFQKLYS